MYGNHMFGGAMFGGIGMLLWWIALLVIVVAAARLFWSGGSARWCGLGASALDILKQRYAKGEINKQEFEERKATLMQ